MKTPSEELKDKMRDRSYHMSKKRFIAATLISWLLAGGLYSLLSFLLNPYPLVKLIAGILTAIGTIIGNVRSYKLYVSNGGQTQR